MTRNLDNRVEVTCPIFQNDLKQEINDIFETQKWRLETFSETYKNYTESSWRGGRNFTISLIYRFNQKKTQTNNRPSYEDYGGEGFGG